MPGRLPYVDSRLYEGEPELLADRPWSTVWRAGDLWLKRCKGIWRFEPGLTVALAGRWPDRLPEVVDHGEDWLLLRSAGAVVEGLPHAHELWLEAIRRYAELQRGELPWRDDQRERFRRFEPRWGDSCVSHPFFSLVVTFMFVESGHDEIRDAYLEAYGGGREQFDRALGVGRIAHIFKWIRLRDELPAEELPQYDGWFVDWIEQAARQLDE